MNKVLFAHDHIFLKYKDKFYSRGGLTKEILEKYTNIFDEVNIVSRQEELSSFSDKLTMASTERINFIRIPNFKSISRLYLVFKAKSLISMEIKKCDMLIARLPSFIGYIAVKTAIENKKPFLVEAVACSWDELWNYSFKAKLIAPINYYLMKKIILRAPFVLYVTSNFLQRRYPTKGRSVNCSDVALEKFDNTVFKKRLSRINNMKENNKIVIGTAAALNVKYKGQQYVIQALGKLKEKGITNYEYQLVGGGDQTYLKFIAKKYNVTEQVKFLGSIPHDEVFIWLDSIDIYVQPSRQEGLPRALIEAMSRGCPALGSTAGGIPELLYKEFIFHKGSVNEICKILKKIDRKNMPKVAKHNFEKAKEYDKQLLDEKRAAFFKEFIAESSS